MSHLITFSCKVSCSNKTSSHSDYRSQCYDILNKTKILLFLLVSHLTQISSKLCNTELPFLATRWRKSGAVVADQEVPLSFLIIYKFDYLR